MTNLILRHNMEMTYQEVGEALLCFAKLVTHFTGHRTVLRKPFPVLEVKWKWLSKGSFLSLLKAILRPTEDRRIGCQPGTTQKSRPTFPVSNSASRMAQIWSQTKARDMRPGCKATHCKWACDPIVWKTLL